jgi:hypothetical protein
MSQDYGGKIQQTRVNFSVIVLSKLEAWSRDKKQNVLLSDDVRWRRDRWQIVGVIFQM